MPTKGRTVSKGKFTPIAYAPTAPPLQVNSFATQHTPHSMKAGVQLFRHRRPVPVGHAGRRRLLQSRWHPVAKCSVLLDGLARSWPIV
jgi:hypothetical protein